MNHIKNILTATLLTAAANVAVAQRQITEGTVEYSISITSSKADAAASNLGGASLSIYLRPTVSSSQMKSSLGSEASVFDAKSGKGFILKEYSGQKLMITLNKDNWSQKNLWNNSLDFKIDNETVEINGFNCKKATAEVEGKTFVVYFTPDVQVANQTYNNAFKQLPGLPVQYQMQSGNLTFTYNLKQISEQPVSNAHFEAPKTGYRVMTFEENQQLKKGK